MWGRGTRGLETDGDCQPVRAPCHVDSCKSKSTEKRHIEVQTGMGHNPRGRNTFDHQRCRSRKSTTSEFSSDKNSPVSDHSLPQPGPRRLKSGRKNGLGEASNSYSLSLPPGHSGQRSGNYPSDEHVNFPLPFVSYILLWGTLNMFVNCNILYVTLIVEFNLMDGSIIEQLRCPNLELGMKLTRHQVKVLL